MNENEKDEQFYRDTEAIAFPSWMTGSWPCWSRWVNAASLRRGEILIKAGQRDLGMTVILSGGLEAFETRDGSELILATPGPRDFVGEIAMLTGNATLASVRGKAELSEVLIVGAAELRRALSELPGLGEIIVSALIMRRKRLLAGPRIFRVSHRGLGRVPRRTSAWTISWTRIMCLTD